MSSLYEITGDYLRFMDMLEGDDPISEQVFQDTLEALDGEFEDKADNYARIIRNLHGEAEKYAQEAKRMKAKADMLENNEARLKQHLYNSMKATGKLKFKTDLFNFLIKKNGGVQSMEMIEGQKIPKTYMKMVPDNTKIRQALEEGKKLKFAVLKERGDHLVIR